MQVAARRAPGGRSGRLARGHGNYCGMHNIVACEIRDTCPHALLCLDNYNLQPCSRFIHMVINTIGPIPAFPRTSGAPPGHFAMSHYRILLLSI